MWQRACSLLTKCPVQFTDRANPMEKHVPVLASKYGISAAPITPQMFGAAGKEHMEKYGERVGFVFGCARAGLCFTCEKMLFWARKLALYYLYPGLYCHSVGDV